MSQQIAYCLSEDDARRISAVLNACIDLPDDALAGGWTHWKKRTAALSRQKRCFKGAE